MRQAPTSANGMHLVLGLVLAVVIAASLFGFVFSQASSYAAYEKGRNLSPATDPIGLLAVPWLTLLVAVLVFAAAAYMSSTSTVPSRARIARGCAMAQAVVIGSLGLAAAGLGLVGGLLSGTYDEADLVGFAIAAYGFVLVAIAGIYVAVRATSAMSLGWRAFGALLDLGISWFFASALIDEGIQYSQTFLAGTVSQPIYNPPPYGDWPLAWACAFGIGWLALSIPVVVNALPVGFRFRRNVETGLLTEM